MAAGLTAEFGIAWPPARYGASCATWRRNPAQAVVAVLIASARGLWPDQVTRAWLLDADAQSCAVIEALKAKIDQDAPAPARVPLHGAGNLNVSKTNA